MDTLINQVDHIMLQTKYAKEIFTDLSQVLDLPVTWDIKSYGGIFVSGGICFGNINIEILNFTKVLRLLRIVPDRDGVIGIAFEPSGPIKDTLNILDKRNIMHGKSEPFKTKVNGEKKVLWTNLDLKGMLPKSRIFFCKYNFDVSERRKRLNNKLVERNGGLIKAEYVKEITIGYTDDSTPDLWKKLSDKRSGSSISFNGGPLINLVKSQRDSILSVSVKVKSVDKAREVLSNNKQIKINSNNEIIFKHEKELHLGLKICE